MKKALITGSNGLVGSASVEEFTNTHYVIGIDNNKRKNFFGKEGSVKNNFKNKNNYFHINEDICNKKIIKNLFKKNKFDLIIHCASQPSHEKSKEIPLLDFNINALATIQLLENVRIFCPDAVFIFMSTNKLYGDNPNKIKIKELKTRYDITNGINESMSIDQCTHSVFGSSKSSADLLVQEYGKYFGIKTVCFRSGCISGKNQSSVSLHGFLGYLCKCAKEKKTYEIFGYKGKQVRDVIHSKDLVSAFKYFYLNPKCGEVYNIGGGKKNSCSIIEAISLINKISKNKINYKYNKNNRIGDHICYYTDFSKFKKDYKEWKIKYSLKKIIKELMI
jgi:CDP-paratose 2-epimerase